MKCQGNSSFTFLSLLLVCFISSQIQEVTRSFLGSRLTRNILECSLALNVTIFLYTVRAKSLSEQYIKLLEPGRTIYPTRCTRLTFRLLYTFIFSERELTFTFAICYRPSVCRLSVCNARAPYSGGSNFRQYFYGIRYLGHPVTSTENFT